MKVWIMAVADAGLLSESTLLERVEEVLVAGTPCFTLEKAQAEAQKHVDQLVDDELFEGPIKLEWTVANHPVVGQIWTSGIGADDRDGVTIWIRVEEVV